LALQLIKILRAATLACGFVASGMTAMLATNSIALAASCPNPDALGTSRTLVIDPVEHPRLGAIQYRETVPLADREVVLTFDDGPLPPSSTRILDALAAECVKATYFMVGSMARAHPEMVARIAAAGHTIGTHSQNHPLTFNRMGVARAQREIQGGIAAVTAALGRPPAPFFRIPGFMRASAVESYLASQNLMTWSADIASDDWRHISDKEIVRRTLSRLDERGKGMILMHDIKPATARALPVLLRELKARGYRIVHVVPASGTRLKTATLPQQWSSRTYGHLPQQTAKIRTAAYRPPDRRSLKLAARRTDIRRREAKRRRAGLRAAVIDKGMPKAVPQTPSLVSTWLRFPWQLLQ
jgi:peptidoglycan/xylan/chitin deacetylase (PgdA/CDA1 family)